MPTCGEPLPRQWAERDRRRAIKLHAKPVADMDCQAAMVSIKANERRATLNGANAPPAQLVTLTSQRKDEETSTSTQPMLAAVRALRGETEPDQPET